MTTLTRSYTLWLDLVVELSRRVETTFPRAAVVEAFAETFGCVVSWNWIDADGGFGFELRDPVPGFPDPGEAELWAREGMRIHPLLRWYATTQDPAPMTVQRVPRDITTPRGFALVQELLSPYGLDQQLSVPQRVTAHEHRAFVLARGQDDFGDADLELARRIQPMLALLDRQVCALQDTSPCAGHAIGLTSREVAVLRLLGDGLTATAIGHRLLVSPRTVHTHLRSIYRKLGVTDRMRAVLMAQELGLLPVRRHGDSPAYCGEAGPAGRNRFSAASPRPLLSP